MSMRKHLLKLKEYWDQRDVSIYLFKVNVMTQVVYSVLINDAYIGKLIYLISPSYAMMTFLQFH